MRSTRDSAADRRPTETVGPHPPGIGSLLTSRRIAAGVGLAIVVITALLLFGDARELAKSLRHFNGWLALPIALLTLWNYGWRFVKWEMYLRRLEILRLPAGTSLLVFLSGFSMSLTPGKVGELVKSIYLRRLTGAAVNRTSAIIAAERLTDALAMLALAAVGLFQFSYARPFLIALAALITIGLLAIQRPAFLTGIVQRLDSRPFLGRITVHGKAFLDASGVLLRPAVLARAVALGIVSWAGECVAFFLVLWGLGISASWHLLLVAIFVLAVSSLAGGASMLPGGLGVADASVAGMLLVLVNGEEMSRTVAAAATLLIRFATLWFAVLLGALAVILLERHTTTTSRGAVPCPSLGAPPSTAERSPDGPDQYTRHTRQT